jgi:hypothetical protein
MKRIAHIKDGQIINVSLSQDDAPLAPGTMLEADALAAGYKWATRAATETLPDAENYQVRAWMIRGGLNPDIVPQIIAQVVPESVPNGINRAEALMRWDYAVRVPRDFPLVDVIGAAMSLTPEQIDAAWPEILKL